MIWLEVDEIPLQKIIDDSLKGPFKRKSKFIGHITIARVKRFNNEIDFIKLLGDIEVNKLKIDVTEFCLKSSMLTKSGAIYKDIQTYDLS
jgi:2'-5' RNA ligase